MRRCPSCGAAGLRRGTARHSLVVGDQRFGGRVPTMTCSACGESVVSARHLGIFELGAAMMLASAGRTSPEAFRFMRKAVGLRAADLAELLDVKPETVSRWENGHLPVEGRAFALLGGIVRDRLGGISVRASPDRGAAASR